MRSLAPPVLSALAGSHLVLVQLILLDFSTGSMALNSSNWDLVWSGVTYKGAYGIGTISSIDDSGGAIKGINFELTGVSSASVALALDAADVVQGTPVTIRTALIDTSIYQILYAPIEWTGRLDTMTLSDNGANSSISTTAESTAVDLLHGYESTYSDATQTVLYPGDKAFGYVVDQSGKPVIWPSKAWFLR